MKLVAALVTLTALSLQGAVQFNTGNGTQSGSNFTNVFTFDGGTFSVMAMGFSLIGNGSTFSNAQLVQSSAGLGVCNSSEGLNCTGANALIDNGGSRDFVLLTFSTPVTISSLTISSNTTDDRDVAYMLGNTGGAVNLNNVTVSQLSGMGFFSQTNSNASNGPGSLTLNLNQGKYNAVLFGVKDQNSDALDDYFRLYAATAVSNPEPSTMALLGSGLLLLGWFARRRRSL